MTEMKKVHSRSPKDTEKAARDFVASLEKSREQEQATVVGLYGELGSGKTTFMKSVARAFGVEEIVTSPTFVIQKSYPLKNKRFSNLYHIDAYRLTSGDDLLTLGWERVLGDPKNIIFIEWPEFISSALPASINTVMFETVDETTRDITINLL